MQGGQQAGRDGSAAPAGAAAQPAATRREGGASLPARLAARLAGIRRRGARPGGPAAARPFVSGAAVLALVACAAMIGSEAWHVWSDRQMKLRSVETSIANLARSLMQHTEDSFELNNLLLLDLAERLRHDGDGPEARARLHRVMAAKASRMASGAQFFVFDEEGRWVASSLAEAPLDINVADRDYFRHHRDNLGRQAYFGPPVLSHSRDLWVVTLTRRLEHHDGRFAGVLLASVDAEALARDFARYDLGPGSAIALLRDDGILLSRQPFDPRLPGTSFAHTSLFRSHLPQADTGSFQRNSPVDQVARITAYQRGERLPLVITVSVGLEAALQSWKNEAVGRLAVAGLLSLVLALLGRRLVAQASQRQAAQRRLGEREAEFRLLAENSSDLVARIDAAGCFRYVSPAAQRLFGEEPAALLGQPVMDQVHAPDRPLVEAAVAPMRLGEVQEARISHRLRHGGGTLWAEAALRATRDPATGGFDGAIVVMRDVTDRKAEEQRLEALARTDGLTGIANRRSFDEALAREWRRCARDEKPLSLLLVDVDRFKLYNDHYGHQQGDATLRAVAGAMAAQARRPGDLPARYGGEEMALLLPGTDMAGAMLLAERARAAVEALGIAHEMSPPARRVTVSIGVATARPSPEIEAAEAPAAAWPLGPEALVAAADGALYGAKHAGRNRVLATDAVPPPPPPPPEIADEARRLAVLQRYEQAGIGRSADPSLDRITAMAARCLGMPSALITLVGEDWQSIISHVGFECGGMPRGESFCAHAIAAKGSIFTVTDAATDWRFAGLPIVTGGPQLRFYAAAPLISPEGGLAMGALCVIDTKPRLALTGAQEALLAAFAALAVDHMESLRKRATAA